MIREGNNEEKTKLEDNASIYQKREVRTYKETMAELHGFEKVEYFCHYYLGKILFFAALAAILVYILYSIFRTKPDNVFYIAVVNTPVSTELYDGMNADLSSLMVTDDVHEQVYIDTSYFMYDSTTDYETRMAFVTHIAAAEIDVLILPKTELETQVSNSALHTVDSVLSQEIVSKLEAGGVKLFRMTPSLGPEDIAEGKELTEGIYGIDVTDYLLNLGADMMRERYYIAFVVNSGHTDKYEPFIKYMFSDILGQPVAVEKVATE